MPTSLPDRMVENQLESRRTEKLIDSDNILKTESISKRTTRQISIDVENARSSVKLNHVNDIDESMIPQPTVIASTYIHLPGVEEKQSEIERLMEKRRDSDDNAVVFNGESKENISLNSKTQNENSDSK